MPQTCACSSSSRRAGAARYSSSCSRKIYHWFPIKNAAPECVFAYSLSHFSPMLSCLFFRQTLRSVYPDAFHHFRINKPVQHHGSVLEAFSQSAAHIHRVIQSARIQYGEFFPFLHLNGQIAQAAGLRLGEYNYRCVSASRFLRRNDCGFRSCGRTYPQAEW